MLGLLSVAAPRRAGRRSTVGVSLGGIYERFERDPLPTDGLDHRLNGRFYQAPAELLHALWGDSDGLHWGLWYDTGDETEPVVGGFYARDGGGGFMGSPTLLGVVVDRCEGLLESLRHGDDTRDERDRVEARVRVLLEAVRWFEPDAGGEVARGHCVPTIDGFGAVLPDVPT